ncbi:MAG: competence/damage-inducible protein A [Bacteroidota bacterium]
MAHTAEIITIGDEILYGQTLDTNSHWLSGALDGINIKVIQKSTIGDQEEQITHALREAEKRADIILITGGLGPTNDDLTKPTLAKYFDVQLRLNEEALQEIYDLFALVGRVPTSMNEKQAELPTNAEKIKNTVGTAPGMWFQERGKVFISMPGVPREMKEMMQRTILPRLSEQFATGAIVHRMIRTVGIPESKLAEKIAAWEAALPTPIRLAYLPSLGQVKLRMTATGEDASLLEKLLDESTEALLPLVGDYYYGTGTTELEELVGIILKEADATVATAESCTGGMVAGTLVSIPGSSDYFVGGVVAYDNRIKMQVLGVSKQTLEAHGAVSGPVVQEMAMGVRKKFQTSVGIATSGVAGPAGGSEDKPVGTVWIGYSDERKTTAEKMVFTKDRALNIRLSTLAALNLLRLNFQR